MDAKIDSSTVEALNKLAPAERKATRERMLRALLAERFKLVVHTETREFSVYVLTLAKNGPKFHEAKAEDTYENAYKLPDGTPAGPGFHTDNETAAGQDVAMETLARWLSRRLGRTVVDRTGLAGKYDFKFSWTRDEDENSSDPLMSPILGAIQQQLGLRLESGKGPVETSLSTMSRSLPEISTWLADSHQGKENHDDREIFVRHVDGYCAGDGESLVAIDIVRARGRTAHIDVAKNQARARYALWLAASLKFLVPFSLLVGIGGKLGGRGVGWN